MLLTKNLLHYIPQLHTLQSVHLLTWPLSVNALPVKVNCKNISHYWPIYHNECGTLELYHFSYDPYQETKVCVINLLAAIFGNQRMKDLREKGVWTTTIKNCSAASIWNWKSKWLVCNFYTPKLFSFDQDLVLLWSTIDISHLDDWEKLHILFN